MRDRVSRRFASLSPTHFGSRTPNARLESPVSQRVTRFLVLLLAFTALPFASLAKAQDTPAETPATPAVEAPAVQDPTVPTSTPSDSVETPADVPPAETVTLPAVSPERLQEIFSGDEPRNLEELAAMQDHIQSIVRRVSPAVVGIEVGPSQGSGVVVTDDGYVLTAGHVIMRSKRRSTVRFRDGAPIAAETLGINRSIDSGLAKITQEENWPYVEMGDSSKLKPGQWVLTIGHPGGFQPDRGLVVRLGRVLSVASTGVRTDCALVGGDSGGPLFDMDGRVVGINSRIGDQIVKNIHIPVNTFTETWDRLADGDTWGNLGNLIKPAWLGMSIDAPEGSQVTVSNVVPGGPAALAGIEVGDRIVEFNGAAISDSKSLSEAVSRTPAFELVTVVIERGNRRIAVEMETGER